MVVIVEKDMETKEHELVVDVKPDDCDHHCDEHQWKKGW